jgi:hypothetical protein
MTCRQEVAVGRKCERDRTAARSTTDIMNRTTTRKRESRMGVTEAMEGDWWYPCTLTVAMESLAERVGLR